MKKERKSANVATKSGAVEGEGSYTAARRYNEGVKRSVDSGKTEELAQKAKEALAGPEGPELKRAERIGKKGNPRMSSARR
jgi:hypothetical protein